MMPMPQGAPAGAAPPPAAPVQRPSLPPAVLQALMARQGAPVPQPGAQAPAAPQGAPTPPPNPAMAAFGQAAQMPSTPPRIAPPQMAQQMAQQGRNGDTVLAHLTPGEITIPPQVLSPQLIQILRQAFAQAGLNPAQFTAGSPMASRNPATGAQEFNGGGGGEMGGTGGAGGTGIAVPGLNGATGLTSGELNNYLFSPGGYGGLNQLIGNGVIAPIGASTGTQAQQSSALPGLIGLLQAGAAAAPASPAPTAAASGPNPNLATFAGYDPIQAMTGGGFNFYPNRTLPATQMAPG